MSQSSPAPLNDITTQSLIRRLYVSHFLSAWNARTFEFGAVLFLALIYPDTLLYASIYALLRSLAAALFSARIGSYVDRTDRLVAIRASILWQRGSVVASCLLLLVLFRIGGTGVLSYGLFGVTIALAGVEKLASIGNTVAVERDWVVVICEDTGVKREELNAVLRRIDLFCKLLAPLGISLVEAYGTRVAVATVAGMSALSVGVEYFAIAQVYHALPALGIKASSLPSTEANTPTTFKSRWKRGLAPWITYKNSPVFQASLALSLLYLTVLSTGPHWQTYLLSQHYTPLTIASLRLLAVLSELSATLLAPLLMTRIGPIRAGLWSINYQVLSLLFAVLGFVYLAPSTAALALTAGIVLSRVGLWGFDLSVSLIIQDGAPPSARGSFSSCEIALQNFFELLSFAATVVFAEPREFVFPVLLSYGAVVCAAACFAGFVRRERGHLLHTSKCLGGCGGGEKKKRGGYVVVGEEVELEGAERDVV